MVRSDTGVVLVGLLCVILVAYVGCQIPKVKTQPIGNWDNGIEVGLSTVPVSFDGNIDEGEYSNDCFQYRYGSMFGAGVGLLYAKHGVDATDGIDWTYLGIDIITDIEQTSKRRLTVSFNTENREQAIGAVKGFYNLELAFVNPTKPTEVDSSLGVGTALFRVFKKGIDYDWQYYFGPSAIKAEDHTQFEVKVHTGILTEYSGEPAFSSYYDDYKNDTLRIQSNINNIGVPLIFKEEVVPEFSHQLSVLLIAVSFTILPMLFKRIRGTERVCHDSSSYTRNLRA